MRTATITLPRPRVLCLFASAAALGGCLSPSEERKAADGSTSIPLASGRVLNVDEPVDAQLGKRLAESEKGRVHLFVRIAHDLTPDQHRELLDAGLTLLDYLAHDTYTASLSVPADLAASPFASLVRWEAEIEPRDKVLLGAELEEPAPWNAVPDSDRRRVLVVMHDDVEEQDGAAVLAGAGLRGDQTGSGTVWLVEAGLAQIEALSRRDEVMTIAPGPEPIRPQNLDVRAAVGTDLVQKLLPTVCGGDALYIGLTGANVRVGVVDFGIDELHPDFGPHAAESVCGITPPSRFYLTDPSMVGHGTHVASILAGNGAQSCALLGMGAFDLRGHAPRACLGEYIGFPDESLEYLEAVIEDRTQVFNHSYVLHNPPMYLAVDREYDRWIRGGLVFKRWSDKHWLSRRNEMPSRVHVFAAGNFGICGEAGSVHFAGYHSVGVSAKNALVVGSIDVEGLTLSQFSSLGPTFDGRVKPEVVAPGTHQSHSTAAPCPVDPFPGLGVVAATLASDYTRMSGTSMAAPVVTGVIALMMEAVDDLDFGLEPDDLRASTWRALVVNTAQDLVRTTPPATSPNPDTGSVTTYDAEVDHATGFGMVRAIAACDAASHPNRWFEASLAANGDFLTACIPVLRDTPELSVTLAWDDPPGALITDEEVPRLVNDLDLELIAPDGTPFQPFTVPALPVGDQAVDIGIGAISAADLPPAAPARDDRNNVERAIVHGPRRGTWMLRVRASHLADGWTQPFSVASSHHVVLHCAVVHPLENDLQARDLARWLDERYVLSAPVAGKRGAWEFPPTAVLPVRCLFPEGERQETPMPAWLELPGFEIRASELPEGAQLVLFDGRGAVRDVVAGREPRALRLERRRPAELFYLLLAARDGEPLAGAAEIHLELVEFEDR